jgi:hypothetical protein
MLRLLILVGFAIAMIGCASKKPPVLGNGNSNRAASTTPADDQLLPDVNFAPTSMPSDIYSAGRPDTQGGSRNISLDQRVADAADRILDRIKPRLKDASPEQLIAGLRQGPPRNDVEYEVWLQGNTLIIEELIRRGPSAKTALQNGIGDHRGLWTGSNGFGGSVSGTCAYLLKRLDPKTTDDDDQ